MQPKTSAEVPVQHAYAAAEDRALRTTQALILAEAQVLTLQNEVWRLERENLNYAAQLRDYEEAHEDATEPDEGVTEDAEDDEDSASRGAADTAQSFYD